MFSFHSFLVCYKVLEGLGLGEARSLSRPWGGGSVLTDLVEIFFHTYRKKKQHKLRF